MLGLALVLALTQTPQHRLFTQPNLPRTSFAFFEFAPENGSGMGAACACSNPTGAKGEALTFTRGSSGTCLKSGTTTGIANGDMVTCTSNQPRVMPGGDGTGGVGLLVEGARTNVMLRSQELDGAPWATLGSGASAPTVTANAAVAPDGTTTAERVQFAATDVGQYSVVYQTVGLGGATGSYSVFLKGVSGSGTIDLCTSNGVTYTCTSCSFVSASWSRCQREGVAVANTSDNTIGNSTAVNGGIVRSANDVYIWGAHLEAGAFASSYIATAGAAVTRAEDFGYFSGTWAMPGAGWSGAVTWVLPTTSTVPANTFGFEPSAATPGSNRYSFYWSGADTFSAYSVIGGALTETQRTGFSAGAAHRVVAYRDEASTTQTACVDGACSSSAATYTALNPIIRITIGNHAAGGNAAWGVIKGACFDTSSARCR